MKYAEVAVNFPGSRSTFCYAIPPRLSIEVGQAVWVPFGPRITQGIVVELSDHSSAEATKEIVEPVAGYSGLSRVQIRLAQWMSEYYFSPLFDAIALMLPPGFERKFITYFRLAEPEEDFPSLTTDQMGVLHFIKKEGKVSLRELEKEFGVRKARRISDQLLRFRLVVKAQELKKAKVKTKKTPYVKLIADDKEIKSEIIRLNKARAYKQIEVVEFLRRQSQPSAVSEVKESLKCSLRTIKALENRRLLSIELVNTRRDPLFHFRIKPALPPTLTSSQEVAWESIQSNWDHSASAVFLLFGVTGSGKTELYLRALTQVIAMGKRGICLVPEIALTTQIVERFASRFPGRVGVFHSGLSLGEQFDEWQRVAEGEYDVVIGARSALFTPQPDLGLIIVDEEHEWAYKQENKSPRYHAREVALRLAEFSGAVVILGSATPDIESFHRARQGIYHLVKLKERITPRGYASLPEVNIVDTTEELKAGNASLFSRLLLVAIKETLMRNEQIILFLNRRGTATFIQCRNCGFVFRCPRCSIALTYHSADKKLTCHRCHYAVPLPQACPQCLNRRLKFLGIGTQRVVDEVGRLFPKARLLRWDRDVTSKRYAHEELLANFREHRADILIGTQMIAKGLDLPQVTLAGIINADTGLSIPDFRAGERTFQLLCQVAGRAGRGLKAGQVIIQTYSPRNYAIQAAAKHDYEGFYGQEVKYRRQCNYPPFSHFARLIYSYTNDDLCRREAEKMNQVIISEKRRRGLTDLSLLGPVPAFAARVRGKYRWQLILRGSNPTQVLEEMILPRGWIVDVDPVGTI
ncbi:MAG: primosomal protein N' [Dehalococcoidia bacterium]|nr:primosomal protein N' [Dehalococcoidia bacterium]